MTERLFPFRNVYGAAIVLAAITMCRQLFVLFGDGIWDVISWIALVIPLLVIVWKYSMAHANQ